jgi:hypothetical protein
MKPILIAVAIAGMAPGARAQSGPTTYDRYVQDSSFCALKETAWPAWVRTADVAQCPVRNCRPSDVVNGR